MLNLLEKYKKQLEYPIKYTIVFLLLSIRGGWTVSSNKKVDMKAIIYARQSSGSDDYSESVENQITNCYKLARKENLTVIGCYSDLNTSGKTYPEGAEAVAENDIAFQQWFRQQTGSRKYRAGLGQVFCRLAETDYLIVDEMTRLYRPVTRSFLESFVNQKLAGHQVKILQCKGGPLDLNQFDQQLIQTLKNQIQDEAIANQKKKSREQFRKMRDSGYKCNGAKMFGIRYLGNHRLEVIPECAEAIRFIYRNIADYRPYSAIIRDVNTQFRHCFRTWCYESTFFSIARQPIYCGYQYNSNGELIRNVQIAGQEIISYELWQKVGEILRQSRKEVPRRARKHWLPMSGRLVCGCCGGRLTCQIDRGVVYYICNKANLSGTPECSVSRIRFRKNSSGPGLYEALYPFLLYGLREKYRRNCQLSGDREQLAELKTRQKRMKQREQQLADLFLENGASFEQLTEILRKHRERRRELESRIRLLSQLVPRQLEKERSVELPELLHQLRNRSLADPVYESLFRAVIRQITVHAGRIDVEMTENGTVSIPRLIKGRRKTLPDWEIAVPPERTAGDWFETGMEPIAITYLTGKTGILVQGDWLVFKTR